jgi:hypothetical protein
MASNALRALFTVQVSTDQIESADKQVNDFAKKVETQMAEIGSQLQFTSERLGVGADAL